MVTGTIMSNVTVVAIAVTVSIIVTFVNIIFGVRVGLSNNKSAEFEKSVKN
jgi:hypothetical protein